jgi:hypothetical protein
MPIVNVQPAIHSSTRIENQCSTIDLCVQDTSNWNDHEIERWLEDFYASMVDQTPCLDRTC